MLLFLLILISTARGSEDPYEWYFKTAQRCEQNDLKACSLLEDACNKERDARACFHAFYSFGNRGYQEKGVEFLRKACEFGLIESCQYVEEFDSYLKKPQQEKITI